MKSDLTMAVGGPAVIYIIGTAGRGATGRPRQGGDTGVTRWWRR